MMHEATCRGKSDGLLPAARRLKLRVAAETTADRLHTSAYLPGQRHKVSGGRRISPDDVPSPGTTDRRLQTTAYLPRRCHKISSRQRISADDAPSPETMARCLPTRSHLSGQWSIVPRKRGLSRDGRHRVSDTGVSPPTTRHLPTPRIVVSGRRLSALDNMASPETAAQISRPCRDVVGER